MEHRQIKYNHPTLLKLLPEYSSRDFLNKFKNEISLYFVFFNLYDKPHDPINKRVYYNEICDIYRDKYSIEYMTKMYDIALFNRANDIDYKQMIYKIYCQGNCNTCGNNEYCF
jgi:hypothetical protein